MHVCLCEVTNELLLRLVDNWAGVLWPQGAESPHKGKVPSQPNPDQEAHLSHGTATQSHQHS